MSGFVRMMKWTYGLLLPAALIAVFAIPACAAVPEDVITQQEEALDIDGLEQTAREYGGYAEYGATLDEGLRELWNTAAETVGSVVKNAMRSGISLLIVILFCGVGESMIQTAGTDRKNLIPLAGTLSVAAVAVADVNSMLGLGRKTIESMTSFSNVLLPTVAAVTAATGAVTGAAVRQMAAVLFSDLLVNLIHSLLIPLLYGYLAASVSYAALGNEGVKKVGALLKWVTTTLLGAVMLAFVGYLSVSKVVAGSADAMTIKATKFAVSSTIPVVGGILSDAAETILASAGVLKGTVGVFGAVTVLSLCLIPVLRMAVHYLMYKFIGAISAAVGSRKISELVDQIGSAFGLMMGMTGACCLLLLVALVSSITAVSV